MKVFGILSLSIIFTGKYRTDMKSFTANKILSIVARVTYCRHCTLYSRIKTVPNLVRCLAWLEEWTPFIEHFNKNVGVVNLSALSSKVMRTDCLF